MKNKEHSKRRSMKFLLKSLSGDQHFHTNLRGGGKFNQKYKNVFHTLPQIINDPYITFRTMNQIRHAFNNSFRIGRQKLPFTLESIEH